MAITSTDVSVAVNGDIRWTGGAATQYVVLELHRFLQTLADDASASGDDLLDISNTTPSERSTDNIITLLGAYNIDDTMAQHLYDGSVSQASGGELYSGLVVVGALNDANTRLQLVQNNKVLPNYWGAGINADASANILSRMLVKTRTGGADIDGKRLRVQAREWTDTNAEFSLTMGLGNSTAAVFTNDDLNNATAEATAAGWTTISNVEGRQGIDLNNGNGTKYYYSQWNRAALTINQLYERTKWIQMRGLAEDSHTGTGKDNPVGNASITEQAQSFTVGANSMKLTRARFRLKRTGSPTGNITVKLYAHIGTYGTTSTPTGAALATSDAIPATRLRTAYDEIEFTFSGAQQYTMTNGTYYVIAVVYSAGNGSNYVSVEGVETTGHSGNRSDYIAAWAADATDDLWFEVASCAAIHGMSGELFRGITHQFSYDNELVAAFQEDENLSWGSGATAGTGILLALQDDGLTGVMWIQLLTGVVPADNLQVTGETSTATCDVSGTPTTRTVSPAFIGTSTGSALIGAFGIGVEAADLSQNDKVTALDNSLQTPPNNVTFTVGSVVSGEDYVLVGPKAAGSDFAWDQLSLNTTLSGAGEIAVVVTTAIPADTPTSGTLRIETNAGLRRKVSYTAWTGSTFTIPSTNFSGDNATAANDVMISYVDVLADATSEAFITKYSADRNLYVRVRDGGASPIKTFESSGSLSSSGGSVSAIRTTDA